MPLDQVMATPIEPTRERNHYQRPNERNYLVPRLGHVMVVYAWNVEADIYEIARELDTLRNYLKTE